MLEIALTWPQTKRPTDVLMYCYMTFMTYYVDMSMIKVQNVFFAAFLRVTFLKPHHSLFETLRSML